MSIAFSSKLCVRVAEWYRMATEVLRVFGEFLFVCLLVFSDLAGSVKCPHGAPSYMQLTLITCWVCDSVCSLDQQHKNLPI